MATKLKVVMTDHAEEASLYEKFYERLLEYARKLQTFGEIVVVTNSTMQGKIKPKLNDRGDASMFLRYSNEHAGNVFYFMKLKTNKIIHSRDITWMGQTWGEFCKVGPKHQVMQINPDEEQENILTTETTTSKDQEGQVVETTEQEEQEKAVQEKQEDNIPSRLYHEL